MIRLVKARYWYENAKNSTITGTAGIATCFPVHTTASRISHLKRMMSQFYHNRVKKSIYYTTITLVVMRLFSIWGFGSRMQA